MQKKHSIKYTMKKTFVWSMRAEKKKQSVTLLELSWEYMCQVTQFFWLPCAYL